MPKRKHSKSSIPNKAQSLNNLTNDPEGGTGIANVTNISLDSNGEDFLDNTQMSMNKRKKALDKFYNRTRKLSGESQH